MECYYTEALFSDPRLIKELSSQILQSVSSKGITSTTDLYAFIRLGTTEAHFCSTAHIKAFLSDDPYSISPLSDVSLTLERTSLRAGGSLYPDREILLDEREIQFLISNLTKHLTSQRFDNYDSRYDESY